MEFVNVPGLTKNISKRKLPQPGVQSQKRTFLHPSPQCSLTGPSIPHATPRNHQKFATIANAITPKKIFLVRSERQSSGEDEVVEQVRGHQDGKVERRELGCR
jgi:hypothetical protein